MYQVMIKRNHGDVFSSVDVLRCIYMTLIISNCSGDREVFSKLKLIKDDHRSTMSQIILVHLTKLSAEWDIMRGLILTRFCRTSGLPKHANSSCLRNFDMCRPTLRSD